MSAERIVLREPTEVMLVRVADELSEIQRARASFEAAVGLRGRKFYGAFDSGDGHMRSARREASHALEPAQASHGSVTDRLDVVPIRVDHEGGVVVFVVLRANTRRAVVGAPGGNRCLVERVDAWTKRLERNVERLDSVALTESHHPLVGSEKDAARPLDHDFRAESVKQRLIELSTRSKVTHGYRNVIDHVILLLRGESSHCSKRKAMNGAPDGLADCPAKSPRPRRRQASFANAGPGDGKTTAHQESACSSAAPVCRCSVCGQHDLDRQLEQRPQIFDHLLARDTVMQHLWRHLIARERDETTAYHADVAWTSVRQ